MKSSNQKNVEHKEAEKVANLVFIQPGKESGGGAHSRLQK